jgi:hypothetical protein
MPSVLGRWQSARPALLEKEKDELVEFLEVGVELRPSHCVCPPPSARRLFIAPLRHTMQELEPDETKWVRLALVDILWAISPRQYYDDIGNHLQW